MDIIQNPTHYQIKIALEWLSCSGQPNPGLEYALKLVVNGLPLRPGELVAIAHTAANAETLTVEQICGAFIASPGNENVAIVAGDRTTAEALLSTVLPRGCPQRVAASSATSDWIRPQLMQKYQLRREHHPLIMVCSQVPTNGDGRWAVPEDKAALMASIAARQTEQMGRKTIQPDWDRLIQQQRVVVRESEGQIVSVMRWGEAVDSALVIGTFTFPEFRRRGFARQLLAFLTHELLQSFPTVKLWVDDDNAGAIALYQSLSFCQIGFLYTGHFTNRLLH